MILEEKITIKNIIFTVKELNIQYKSPIMINNQVYSNSNNQIGTTLTLETTTNNFDIINNWINNSSYSVTTYKENIYTEEVDLINVFPVSLNYNNNNNNIITVNFYVDYAIIHGISEGKKLRKKRKEKLNILNKICQN